MQDIIFIYPTSEGSKEILFEGDKISFGRGSDAQVRFSDDGLSRLNSTVYREKQNLWIVDENSTNGTFVNSLKVSGNGTPLKNGDLIKIGYETEIRVKFIDRKTQTPIVGNSKISPESSQKSLMFYVLPILISIFALLVMSVSAVVIFWKLQEDNEPTISQKRDEFETPALQKNSEELSENSNFNQTEVLPDKTKTPIVNNSNSTAETKESSLTNSPEAKNNNSEQPFSVNKKYLEMSENEQRRYIEARAGKVARMIGNRDSGNIPALAIDKIKGFLDGYAKRFRSVRTDNCSQGSWVRSDLATVYERASRNAPFIIRSFNAEGIDPQIGLYLAMIESEHCVCLQSPTGPLGMFQFTKATGEAYGLQTFRGASPSNPDERCKPEPASRAAAKYMKFLTGRYGTDPSSVPLAIGSYNSGEGGLSTNLKTALESNEVLERNFWTLIANGEKLSKQFQSENFKYVPKFFAAAIIGENPQDFNLNLQPLSTYTK